MTQNEKKEKFSVWRRVLIVATISLGVAPVVFVTILMVNPDLQFKWPWHKTPVPVEIVEEIPQVSVQGYAKDFLDTYYMEVPGGDNDFFMKPLEKDKIYEPVYSETIILLRLKECCYATDEEHRNLYEYSSEFKFPSLVWKFESGSQLSVEYPYQIIESEDGENVAINKVKNYGTPTYAIWIGKQIFVYDENRWELPRW